MSFLKENTQLMFFVKSKLKTELPANTLNTVFRKEQAWLYISIDRGIYFEISYVHCVYRLLFLYIDFLLTHSASKGKPAFSSVRSLLSLTLKILFHPFKFSLFLAVSQVPVFLYQYLTRKHCLSMMDLTI